MSHMVITRLNDLVLWTQSPAFCLRSLSCASRTGAHASGIMRLWCGPVIECPPQVSTLHSLHLATDATQFYELIYPSAQESTVGSTAHALYGYTETVTTASTDSREAACDAQ